MNTDKPRLLFAAKAERRKFIRRFFWSLLAVVGAIGAWVALDVTTMRTDVDPLLLNVGKTAALGVAALFAVRGFFNLLRGLRIRNEEMRFYDRGFRWVIGKQEHKYTWAQVSTFREGVHQVKLGRFILAQTGAQVLRMADGTAFMFKPVHGDAAKFAARVRPFIADVTGTRMARALRSNRTVRVHGDLLLTPQGLKVGKNSIGWSQVDVEVKGRKLIIRRLNKTGKFKTVRTFDIHQVDNLGGFMEITRSTIQNHQPERFNIKTQGFGYA